MVAFAFVAKFFLESDGDPLIIFCQSLSTVSVVSTLKGGGDTGTLIAIVEFI